MTIGTRLAEGGDCHLSWISRSEPANGWKLRIFVADNAVRTMEGRENIIEVEKSRLFLLSVDPELQTRVTDASTSPSL